jgi:hypothetical protein
MKMMLDYPHQFFLANDSDSICLSPEIPPYLYKEPDVLWSNEVSDMMHDRSDQPGYPWPRIACQPPYFFSRSVLEKLIRAGEKIKADPKTPFIDWCMMAWAVEAGVPHKSFPHGVSCPSANYRPGQDAMRNAVEIGGAVMIHSVNTPDVLYMLSGARISHVRKHKK